MTSSRPYLLRALNEWILDNDLTPHIVVDALHQNVVVPTQYIESNKIVLNISPNAVSGFSISNEYISFSARFSGKSMEIFVPVSAVLALYAKENGQGMVFNEERSSVEPGVEIKSPEIKKEKNSRPRLTLVD
ncbi:MAG: ClpXP protease specificity-enhancing factor [Gammaproteobacteria bacterium]|nr:ClpXP protease specificity-enhancing factor [Gammaproteobacteria bacterium]